jgi:rRNA-processing protein FCF1
MNEYLKKLFYKYKNKGLLIDTNLLLVYFVGIYDRNLIGNFKRTITFTIEDFEKLQRAFIFFDRIVTTPNILTEVNSLSNQLPENIKLKYFDKIKEQISRLEESYVESKVICELTHFPKFGLTDTGIINLVKDNYLVLTDDFRLANYLEKIEVDVINFNRLRDY